MNGRVIVPSSEEVSAAEDNRMLLRDLSWGATGQVVFICLKLGTYLLKNIFWLFSPKAASWFMVFRFVFGRSLWMGWRRGRNKAVTGLVKLLWVGGDGGRNQGVQWQRKRSEPRDILGGRLDRSWRLNAETWRRGRCKTGHHPLALPVAGMEGSSGFCVSWESSLPTFLHLCPPFFIIFCLFNSFI